MNKGFYANQTVLLLRLAFIFAVVLPMCSRTTAHQLELAPNPNWETISIRHSTENNETFNNFGLIYNESNLLNWDIGTINNQGAIENSPRGTIDNSGAINNGSNDDYQGQIWNWGTINNSGTIDNHDIIVNRRLGTINNEGSIFIRSLFGDLSNWGAIDNSGTIDSWGTIDNYYYIYNRGTIDNYNYIYNRDAIGNWGTIDNYWYIYNDGHIDNWGTINNSGTIDSSLGTFNNQGTLTGTGTFIGDLINDSGTVAPGSSAGTMYVVGDYILDGLGILDIEIGGFTAGTFDLLDITGTATLSGGTIDFSFLSGYDIASEISPGQSMMLQFLKAGSINNFSSGITYDFLGTPPGFQYDVFQQGSGLYFQATNTIPAPGAILLGSIGVCVVGWLRRRKTL